MSAFSLNLERLMAKNDIDDSKLAELVDVNRTTVTRWRKGIRSPKLDKLPEIAKIFGVEPLDLISDSSDKSIVQEISGISSQLQSPRQQKVLAYANKQLEEQKRRDKSNKISSIEEYKIKYNNNRTENEKIAFPRIGSTGAGIGEDLYDDIIEETVYFDRNEVDEELLETADFCIYVNGDSMEPAIKRDTYSFVRKTIEIRDGLVALVIYDGTVLIKKIEITEGSVNLVSLNPKYETIRVEPHHQFKLIGKIVQ
ncbi:helix-turn-helix domain-containing protein [Mammaliicoccus sciuri]|uniref:helix-turn-helix domain-containing protein n=1 Tax=Mammaliicoccus sciuri TaxID=1296 RepID=UPI002B25B37D|nr:XRE family transcriptional regulator [Mammaliicoccus sciuri]WQK43252.1 XRE family transcriptional regulator [Mammaliicoccus sciuri]